MIQTWYFLVVTYDVTAGYLKMYLLKDGSTSPTEIYSANIGDVSDNLITDRPYIDIGYRVVHSSQLYVRLYCYQLYQSAMDISSTVELSQMCIT